jgi:hypothetical protein
MRERRGVYRILVGTTEGKKPLGRLRDRWEDNIKMDIQQVGCGGMNWIDLVQNRRNVAGTCECVHDPYGSVNSGNFLTG